METWFFLHFCSCQGRIVSVAMNTGWFTAGSELCWVFFYIVNRQRFIGIAVCMFLYEVSLDIFVRCLQKKIFFSFSFATQTKFEERMKTTTHEKQTHKMSCTQVKMNVQIGCCTARNLITLACYCCKLVQYWLFVFTFFPFLRVNRAKTTQFIVEQFQIRLARAHCNKIAFLFRVNYQFV